MLPIEIQMQIDLSAQHHSREIAQGFAKLRAKLPPAPVNHMARLQAALVNGAFTAASIQQMQQALRPSNPFLPNMADMQSAYPAYCGVGCLGVSPFRQFFD